MTVSAQVSKNVSIAAPGATEFAYAFKITSKADLSVLVDLVPKVVDVDFTVDGVGTDGGGNIYFVVPLVGGERVLRKRAMPYARDTDYQNLGDLRSATLNNDQDAPVLMLQQVVESVQRSLRLPEDSTASAQLPALVPLMPFVVNATGDAIEMGNPAIVGDMLLRGHLADAVTAGRGSAMVAFRDTLAPAYLKTLSDIENGNAVSVFRFINPLQIAAIKDRSSTYNATSDLQSAFNSGARSLRLHDGLFRIGTGLTLSGKTDFSLLSDGAVLYIDNPITGLTISGCDGVKALGELNFTGLSTATGFYLNNNVNSQFAGFRAKSLAIGGVLGVPTNSTYGGVSVPNQTRLHGFSAIACGTGFRADGEYYEMVAPHVSGCTAYGLHIKGGNFSGVGGVVNGNRIGAFVEGGVIGNSDHGKLVGMTINHNLAANLYVKDTAYAFHVTGCDLWAAIGDGTGANQLTEEGRTTSFGVYLKNCENINLSGNTIARNAVDIGLDGVATSVLTPNVLVADPARTTSHIKEYGANHDVYGKNAQNLYGPNVYDGALFGGSTKRVEVLTSNLSQANRVGGSTGTTGNNFDLVDNTVSGTVTYEGNGDALTVFSDTAATINVAPSLFSLDFKVAFVSVSGGSKAITITSASTLTSQTAGAAVSGADVTFNHSGTYLFTATGLGKWTITCASGSEAIVAPTLTNSWANLAGGFETVGYWRDGNGDVVLRGAMNVLGASNTSAFTLPAGYRPAAKIALAIGCDVGKSGFVTINTDGTVVPSYEAASTFVSLSGLRFRVN